MNERPTAITWTSFMGQCTRYGWLITLDYLIEPPKFDVRVDYEAWLLPDNNTEMLCIVISTLPSDTSAEQMQLKIKYGGVLSI